MKTVRVFHYDAFSSKPNKGNPAGVVLDADGLTEKEMQDIAMKVGFNETSFPMESDIADLRIRYFTPGNEMNLCGHATMATIHALKTRGLLDKDELMIETGAGILPIKIHATAGPDIYITMKQAAPQFEAFNGDKAGLASSLGLDIEDLESELPIVYGSTGLWTLLVPVKERSSFKRMKANNSMFPQLLKEMPRASVHPFCLETYDNDAHMHARHFSSPFSGTLEDPVTGTASGVMGAYYAKYIKDDLEDEVHLLIEQGHEIGKDGRVHVTATKNDGTYDIEITGNAVYVKEFEVEV
ncbi:PhzF family phenazine biosynthesis protein [Peribacillus frigoritolerans]|uniref:PhzF family phenazine biosynthesis protein n=1 Tax=Peribacillus frigoritolerans TaxID=450367 RepID=UPI001EFC5220|nr:PhzF family phenazine biosynthesis protein [Peribacillus frigoritolerans]ULM96631.1 PhzF family phenazine biosynthesis protein [Peribacillus frigoritolerans]